MHILPVRAHFPQRVFLFVGPVTRTVANFALCAALVLAVGARTMSAQTAPSRQDSVKRTTGIADTIPLTTDSLAARLARAEAAIALLQQQLAVEASTSVRTRSRLQLELSGRVLTNSYYTTGRTNSVELPLFVREPVAPLINSAGSAGKRGAGLSLRQSFIGAALSVDSVLGATFVADIDVDFFAGGTAYTADPFGFPLVRLRTVNAQLRWPNTTLMVGSETPLISDVNPVSLAAAGTPAFALAGNLWNWIPQIRASRVVARRTIATIPVSWSVHGAMLAPAAGLRHTNEVDGIDAGERSARPALEGRVSMQWGATDASDDVRGDVGIGVHRGWLRANGDTLTVASAYAADARIGLAHGVTLLAEAYAGRAISSLGGAAIGQSFGTPRAGELLGPAIRNIAGWMQLNAQLRPTLTVGAGCGMDVPNQRDGPRRLRNGACATHVLWRPTQPVLVGFEVRQLATRYVTGTEHASHFNLALGFEW